MTIHEGRREERRRFVRRNLFWIAPIIGAALGAFVYRFIGNDED